jgi:hypothetical protein
MDYGLESSGILSSEIKLISKELAIEMLNNNAVNRVINKSKVRQYAEMMKSGQWQLTHQGLAITKDGKLIDGQHRLWAIVETGIPIRFFVTVYEAGTDAMRFPFDIVNPRSHADILRVNKHKSRIAKTIGRILLSKTDIITHEKILTALKPELDWFVDPPHVDNHCKTFSSAGVESAVVLRKAMGIDFYDQWLALCDSRLADQDSRTKVLGNYLGRLHAQWQGQAYEDSLFMATWKATDPNKVGDIRIVLRKGKLSNACIEAREWFIEHRMI